MQQYNVRLCILKPPLKVTMQSLWLSRLPSGPSLLRSDLREQNMSPHTLAGNTCVSQDSASPVVWFLALKYSYMPQSIDLEWLQINGKT